VGGRSVGADASTNAPCGAARSHGGLPSTVVTLMRPDIPSPLRVAFDAGPLYGHRSGVGIAVDGMATALGERPDVALTPYLTSRRSAPHPGHRRLPLPGIVASHVWSRSDHPSVDRWLPDVDLVHGTNYVAPPSHRPTVVSVYDCWFLRHADRATPLVRRAGRNLQRAVARGAWLHVTSDATAAQARELLRTDRVMTVYLGAPPAPPPIDGGVPSSVADLAGRRLVVAVGTEERRKDLPLLVKAFSELAVDRDDIVLTLAGARGDDSERLADAIAASPCRDRIRRLGPVDQATKAWLLRHATTLVYPSLDEGFGFPILEANAAGTPVVATAVGSVPEIAGGAAVLVDDPSRSPDTLAEAVAGVLDGHDRLALIEAGYRNVRRFDWATTAERLVELYHTAAQDRA
jgi:glycosyltransferase involved in cell wall biosynthesis